MNHLLTWAIIGALLLAAAGFASLALACCALAARADRRSEQAAPTLRCLRCGRVRPAGECNCSCHPEVDWARHEEELKNL